MNKKAQVFDNLAGIAVGVVTFAIIMVVCFIIITNTQSQVKGNSQACDNATYAYNISNNQCCTAGACNTGYSLAWNSTGTLQSAASSVPGWIPLVLIIAIGSIILTMIGMFRR